MTTEEHEVLIGKLVLERKSVDEQCAYIEVELGYLTDGLRVLAGSLAKKIGTEPQVDSSPLEIPRYVSKYSDWSKVRALLTEKNSLLARRNQIDEVLSRLGV
jgi:hypothetical protein